MIDQRPVNEVLNHVDSAELGIHIDAAMVRKVLSATNNNQVPDLWLYAKSQGPETVNALTLISIIFSHYELIVRFINATGTDHRGTIERESLSGQKAFTNLSNNVYELGYSTQQQYASFSYDISGFFDIHGLGSLVRELLELKLLQAGWDRNNSVAAESLQANFHRVFGLSENDFKEWLSSGTIGREARNLRQIDDIDFLTEDGLTTNGPFEFRPGHSLRKEGESASASRNSAYTSSLKHNEIQNSLFQKLEEEYGSECVGTEVSTGWGTSIDLIVKTDDFCWFYEIKTASTAKLCIRQAIPQLLEYAYWGGNTRLVDKLIIVSQNELDEDSAAYLKLLRDQFGLNLHYECHQPQLEP